MNSFQQQCVTEVQRHTRLVLTTILVVLVLWGCANDTQKRRLNEPVVESATPSSADSGVQVPSSEQTIDDAGPSPAPSESASSGDDSQEPDGAESSPNAEEAPQWCVDTKVPIPVGTSCYFDLPSNPPGHEIDTDTLQLRFSGYNGDTELFGDITRIFAPQDCKSMGAQWYYYQEANGTFLVLCPNACGIGSQGGEGLLWVRAECL